MRNMLMVGAASFALLGATQAMAAGSDTDMTYNVAVVCGVVGLTDIVVPAGDPLTATESAGTMTLTCNDGDGFTLNLTSTNGGLENATAVGSPKVDYDAVLTPSGPGVSGGTLEARGTAGTTEAIAQTSSTDIAAGADATLDVTALPIAGDATKNFTFAGAYTDTITVGLSGI